jgi:hypothetical protein
MARAILDEARRSDLNKFARRIAEAELDLRRIRRARQTLAKPTSTSSSSDRLAASPNATASTVAGRDEGPRAESFISVLRRRRQAALQSLDAREHVTAQLKRGAKNVKQDVLERCERRATSRQSG